MHFYRLAKTFLLSHCGVHLLLNYKGCNNLENLILLRNAVAVIVLRVHKNVKLKGADRKNKKESFLLFRKTVIVLCKISIRISSVISFCLKGKILVSSSREVQVVCNFLKNIHEDYLRSLNLKVAIIKNHVWQCFLGEGERNDLQLKYFICTTVCAFHPFLFMHFRLYADQNSSNEQISLCIPQAGIYLIFS